MKNTYATRAIGNKLQGRKLFANNFAIFAAFYIVALWLELAEGWETPWATFASLILLLAIILSGIDRLKFCIFLVLNTLYFLYFHFPEVANHVNLIIFGNVAILITVIYSWLRPRLFPLPQDYYRAIAPIIRISLIAVYFWAGFHKLNMDFLNPYFSCSNSMFMGVVEILTSSIFGIPAFLIFGTIAITFLKNLISQKTSNLIRQHRRLILLGIISSLILISSIVGGLFYFQLARLIFPLFILTTSIVVLLWELVGGIVLFAPQLQVGMFFFSLFMHLVLAPIGFVDFGSLAFALWLTFIPHNYYPYLDRPINIPFVNLKANRILVYVLINIFGGLISGLFHLAYPEFNLKAIAGFLFIISVLIVISPLVKNFLATPYSWRGVNVIDRKMPKFMYLFILILSIYAATPYLGLRTAGNFSMFSNLRTEGESSNHLLLKNNPLKIWNYQEDVVKILEIDDERAKIGHKYRPLRTHFLPVVEFRKLIYKWTQAEYKVPIIFEYRDRIYDTTDIVSDPFWRTPKRTWEMKLMDFRVIQPDNGEPNYCRW